MSNEVSQQAEDMQAGPLGTYAGMEDSGDVEAPQEAGNIAVSVVPEAESTVDQPSPVDEPSPQEPPEEIDSGKKQRKSDAEWQQMKEASTKFEKLMEAMAESAGIKKEDISEEDVMAAMSSRVEKLQSTIERQEWEIDHPIVRTEKYSEEWKRVNSEDRYQTLTFEEKWALINKEKGLNVEKELRQQAAIEKSSVPASKSSDTVQSVDSEALRLGRIMRLKPEDCKKAGVKL